jgi:putative endopeptidase
LRNLIFIVPLAVMLSSCTGSGNDVKLPEVGIILSNRDTTVSPGEDFFKYVNGGWLSRTVIPADRGSWGSFNELQKHNNQVVREVLTKASQSLTYPEGTDQRKAADFYNVGMDSLQAEKMGITPLKGILDKIESIANKNDLQRFLTEEDAIAGDAFFSFTVSPDSKNSKRMAAYLGSGGLGLPERDYYLKTDAKSQETRDRYKQHISSMLVLTGWDLPRSRKSADGILTLETELANAMLSKEDKRDPVKQYNKKAVADLSILVHSIDWPGYFTTLGVREDSVIVTEPAFLKGCDHIINSLPLDGIKAYLRWTVIRQAAPFLNHAFVTEAFDFNTKYLLGAATMRPRWQRVLDVSDQYMGEAIGKLYVAEAFPPEAKKKAKEMVDNIRFAFADRIKQLDWMSDSTKRMALHKLGSITVKIGYPDKWKNYAGLVVDKLPDKGSYYGNILNASRYQVLDQIGKLGKPVDKSVWEMTPQTVNAYYNPQFNEIVFPAGILQPPFYDFRADEAVNYGGIGAAIGHEISHGFDDQGSQYDADGNLRNWWRPEDLKNFTEKGKELEAQFDKYQPLPGVSVQGKFTLGENIGDLGGLNAAYDGFLRYLRENNLNPGLIDGLTAHQRFFMSWATIWRVKYRDEALRTLVLTNEHAPGMYRANGPVSNMVEFYQAFGVKAGDKMYRDDRVKIW